MNTMSDDQFGKELAEMLAEVDEFEKDMNTYNIPVEEWFYEPAPEKPWYKEFFTTWTVAVILLIGSLIFIIVYTYYQQ